MIACPTRPPIPPEKTGASNSPASRRVREGSGYEGSRWAVAPRPSTRRNAPARGLG